VLVPVFKEANIVPQLVGNLGKIDYPADKLEVLVLIEEEDHLTRDAYLGSNPPPNFHILTIPKGTPQTKPRACNVGLYFASGEYLVIFDAEDAPDPDQLKKCVVAFRRGGAKTVCVQAALNYFNADENALTRMFTLEYNYWFDYMLAGLDAADLPIPLGGTSNHFRTEALIELGGWDPYNVTEDADLGIRASAMGFRVGVVNSTTMEEANTSIPNFIRQRSRWIKGYMQTSLVHARRPLALIREVGLRRFASFALLIAGTPIAIRNFTTAMARADERSRLEGNSGVLIGRLSEWPSTRSTQSISSGMAPMISFRASASTERSVRACSDRSSELTANSTSDWKTNRSP
jgi:cellulose synthase/poly-beta-1,6-N-acetylglucosamine synthase-like glycosyltransferase